MSSFRTGPRKPYSRPTAPRGDSDGQWLHDKAPTGPRGQRKTNGLNNGTIATPTPMLPAGINTKLVVSNLHYEVTPKDLSAIFGQIGTLVREPLLRYDKSGRSIGVAIVAFETAAEATRAKKQFDGILAKGQPMSIAFDTMPPRQPRRATSAPSTSSLLNRIQKPPLLDRLSRDDTDATITPRGPKNARGNGRVGPIRSKPLQSERRGGKVEKKPKTAEDLDKELDAFMGDAEPVSTAPAAEDELVTPAQDVEMA